MLKKDKFIIKLLGKHQIKSLYLHPHSRKEYDSIAQLVEHITFNDGVLGSSPSRVTKGRVILLLDLFYFKATWRNGRLAILRGWCSKGRVGSNPTVVTNKKKCFKNNQACLKLFLKHFCFQSGTLLGMKKSIQYYFLRILLLIHIEVN